VGAHTVTGIYSGDASFNGSTSAVLTQTVNKANTSTTVTSSVNPSASGQAVTFTATVSAVAPGAGTPSGTVQFTIDGVNFGAPVTLVAGSATSGSTSTLSTGTHSVTGIYSGDANFNGSTSPTLTQTVGKSGSTTTVTSSTNPSVFGQSVSFTATVAPVPPTTGTPTGTVQFTIDGVNFGTPVTLVGGIASSGSTSTLSVGAHSVSGIYSGDTTFAGSTGTLTQTVNKASTTTSLTSSANPSACSQSITFTATVGVVSPGAGSPSGTVQFTIDGVNFGAPVTLVAGSATSGATSTLSPGTHTVTAIYSGDTSFNGSTSQTLTQTVNKCGSTTTVTSSVNPSVFGQGVTFTATVTAVAPATGTPTGTVQFTVDGVNFGAPVTLVGGSATSGATSTLSVGTHSVTGIYSGDASFNGSTSAALTQTVNKANTATTVTSSTNPSVFGQSVSFTATVAAVAPGAGTPTGTVQFTVDGVNFGAPVTLVGGSATSGSTSTLSVGTHTVTGVYSGSTSFNVSTSAALTQTVNKANTTTSLTSSVNPSASGQAVSFTATVAAVAPGAGTPTGTVQFTIDGVNFGAPVTLVGGSATSGSTSTLSTGTHSVTGIYSGDANFNGSTSAVLTQNVGAKISTTTTVTSSTNPSVFGQSVSFRATVAPVPPATGTPTGTVQFTIDGVNFGAPVTLVGGIASSGSTSTLSVGVHSVSGIYSGDTTFAGSTGALTQTVNKASTTTTVTSSMNPSVFGQSVSFTATVAAVAPGAGTPTGTVQFTIDGVNFGAPVALVGGSATSGSTSTLTVGAHSVTGVYSGDANFNTSTGALTQTVNKANTTTTVTSSMNPSTFGQSVTFTATVTAVSPGAGSPSGTVTFFDGTTTLGTGALSAGHATFTTSSLSVGPHSITASYGGDASFNGSTSAILTQTVNSLPVVTITTTVSATSLTVGGSISDSATLSGQTATAAGTVTYNEFANGTCSTPGPINMSTVMVTNGVVPNSGAFPANRTGSFSFQAVYSGDANNSGATSACEPFTVNKISPTLATTVSSTSAVLGSSVSDSATLSNSFQAGGTVTYTLFSGGTCSGTGTTVSTVTVTNGSVPNSAAVTPTTATTFSFQASYSGDSNNNMATSSCEPFNITDFTITASTTTIMENVNDNASITITVAAVNGFTGTVMLTTNPSAGLGAQVFPISITGSGTSTLFVFSATAANYMVTVTGTSGPDTHTTPTINVQVVDFQIFASPAMINTTPGVAGTTSIDILPLNGFTGTVTLTSTISPSTGLTCTLTPSMITGGSGTSTLSCTGSGGTFTVTVTGKTPSMTGTPVILSHSTMVTVNVMDFTLTSCSPQPVVVNQGGNGSCAITVTPVGGFTGTVTLSFTNNGTITAAISPTTITISGTATLTVTTTGATPLGLYVFNVTGTSPGLSHSTGATFKVTQIICPSCAPPDMTQMQWTHRLSLSKTGGTQTWKFGVSNGPGGSNTVTIYVNVRITATDGSAGGFTLNSGVLTLGPGKNLVNQQLSITLPATDQGATFNWSVSIQWGTSPTALTQTTFTDTNGVPTSGSFTVLA